MRIVVVGAGAVGSLFGARLAAAGHDVVLIGRADHLRAIDRDGLVVEGTGPLRVRVATAERLAPGTRGELVLVTTKSYDLRKALRAIGSCVPRTGVVLLGNGLGLEEVALGELRLAGWPTPEACLLRVVHTVPARRLGPGVVRATGTGEVVVPTEQAAGAAAPVAARLAEALAGTGLPVRRTDAPDREIWRKLVVNAAINPVTALRGLPNGALASGEPRREAERLLGEAVAVAQRAGVALTLDDARADLERIVQATAENRSSMLEDLDRGRPTEIDAILGEVVRRGTALGVPVPATQAALGAMVERLAARRSPAKR
ncbi:MAG TPA: 2-dehydropantoate 2-reductase [Thermoplasmata archaeon]|nr:2-dehydropantoate 2-reductase [Thermoplasmata archaeon]